MSRSGCGDVCRASIIIVGSSPSVSSLAFGLTETPGVGVPGECVPSLPLSGGQGSALWGSPRSVGSPRASQVVRGELTTCLAPWCGAASAVLLQRAGVFRSRVQSRSASAEKELGSGFGLSGGCPPVLRDIASAEFSWRLSVCSVCLACQMHQDTTMRTPMTEYEDRVPASRL